MGALIASGTDWARRAEAHAGERLPLPSATTEVPPLVPGRVVRVGPNYPTRLRELDRQRPTAPSLVFVRLHTVAGPRTVVPLPAVSSRWGVELGVVVSHRVRLVLRCPLMSSCLPGACAPAAARPPGMLPHPPLFEGDYLAAEQMEICHGRSRH